MTVPATRSEDAASLYFGEVMHARLKPMGHRFSYRVMSLLIDLDRLDAADRQSPLFDAAEHEHLADHLVHAHGGVADLRERVGAALRCEAGVVVFEKFGAGKDDAQGGAEFVRDGAQQVILHAEEFALGLASSSNREVIDLVLDEMGVAGCFAASVSSEEVGRGKPAPDVYLEAMRRAGIGDGIAIEDSENGIKSAHAAGLRVIAIPNPHFPPPDDALTQET